MLTYVTYFTPSGDPSEGLWYVGGCGFRGLGRKLKQSAPHFIDFKIVGIDGKSHELGLVE